MIIVSKIVKSPLGSLLLTGTDHELLSLEFYEEQRVIELQKNGLFEKVEEALLLYFSKQIPLPSFPCRVRGTPFQQKVWQELGKIPFGETRSYQEIAIAIGHEKAVRAVGSAIGCNPLPVFIPCHRVIRTDGALGGFRWGLAHKKWLLAHETTLSW